MDRAQRAEKDDRAMNPTLTVDLAYLRTTARRLSARLRASDIELLGVTKAVDGEPAVGRAFLEGGCVGLADSRLPPLRRLAQGRLRPLTMIRAPQPQEIEAVARLVDRVFLSRPETARALGEQTARDRARDRPIEILLTVDLGDRREGVLPEHAAAIASEIARTPRVSLAGVAVNFACLSGQLPSNSLFRDAEQILATLAHDCGEEPLLSLGGTCCLQYVDGYRPRFRTELRAGVALLHGWDIVSASAIEGLEARDPVLTATVLECQRKPPAPVGSLGRDAFGREPDTRLPQEDAWYALLYVGRRDCEPHGMRPLIDGAWLAGMTSDVAVLVLPGPLAAGDEVSFALDYEALVRAITSPFVTKRFQESS
jgi:predicted amino acid racemase